MRKITHYIKSDECVGDSIAKHNFNFLILDTFICNISSSFFYGDNSFKKYFDIFNDKKTKYDSAYLDFNSNTMFRYDLMNSEVKLLSSYWNKYEYSMILPFNLSKEFGAKKNYYTKPQKAEEFETQRKECLKFLDKNFPSSTITNRITANVIVYYHTITDDNVTNSLVNKWDNDISDFTAIIREIKGEFNKKDISVDGVNVFKFENSNNIWNLFEISPSPQEQNLPIKIGNISKVSNSIS